MTTTAFFRILWKEYRTQRAFWISVAVAIASFDLALAAAPWILQADRPLSLLLAAFALAALYTLGTAATLFATERENGTYDILQALPVGPWTVFFGKAVFAFVSAAAMFGFGWIIARVLAGGLPAGGDYHREYLAQCFGFGLMAVEFWAWGIFFSLLSRRTIVAAILAGPAATLAVGCFSSYGGTSELLLGPLLLVGLVAANLIVANRWLREKRLPRVASVRKALRGGRHELRQLAGRLGRLVWQEMRQSAVLTSAILGMLLPLALYAWIACLTPGAIDRLADSNFNFRFRYVLPLFAALVPLGCLAPVLLGSTVFLGDQAGYHFRFLAERGFPPRLIWLSRHFRCLAVILFGGLLFVPPSIVIALRYAAHKKMDESLSIDSVIGYAVAAYACGQLCSLLFRSGILAVAFGGILTAIVCGWASFVYFFGMSWLWTVVPLLLAFMAATWLHAPNWLVERKTWRAWLPLAAAIAVPLLAILAAIPLVRIYEIPYVDLGFDPNGLNWPMPPEEKETLALYGQAYEFYGKSLRKAEHPQDTPAEERTLQEDKEQAIALAMKASSRPLRGFYVAPPGMLEPLSELALANLVRESGEALRSEGKLDAALDRYLAAMRITLHAKQRYSAQWESYGMFASLGVFRGDPSNILGKNAMVPTRWEAYKTEVQTCEDLVYWSAERGQTSDRVLKARQALEELWRTPPTYCEEIKYVYFQFHRILEDKIGGLVEARDIPDLLRLQGLARWMPWERVRAMRILNMLTAERLARCQIDEAAMAEGRSVPPAPKAELERQFQKDAALQRDNVTYDAVRQNLPAISLDKYVSIENCHRATRLVMALEAWRLDHGKLPDSLDALQDKYLDRIPVDPNTGERFAYEPHGVGVASEFVGSVTFRIEPGQPFVGGPMQPGRFEGGAEDRPAFAQGWVCPIPEAGGKRVRPKTEASGTEAGEAVPPSP